MTPEQRKELATAVDMLIRVSGIPSSRSVARENLMTVIERVAGDPAVTPAEYEAARAFYEYGSAVLPTDPDIGFRLLPHLTEMQAFMAKLLRWSQGNPKDNNKKGASW